ncbi:hypothetical protein GF323_03930 [Candidatus Woesearchaeota archaeon]|nr:hypothetical protein [Candidatus Woesearchaeota archaeon]
MRIKLNALNALLMLFILLGMAIVAAAPEGPDELDVMNSTRRTVKATQNISALAGNVTQLNISGTFITQSWQGYYGNVSGTIALDASDGYRMFSWDIASPQGEVYATEGIDVPTWGGVGQSATIECWNYTKGRTTAIGYPYYGEVEGWNSIEGAESAAINFSTVGMGENDPDSINNTFYRTSAYSFPSFYAGRAFINGTLNNDQCPSLALYNSTNASTYGGSGDLDPSAGAVHEGGDFQEVILIDTSKNYLIFTAITDLTKNTKGFNNRVWDFQMIVPEDGHGGDITTTEYNFYVELE